MKNKPSVWKVFFVMLLFLLVMLPMFALSFIARIGWIGVRAGWVVGEEVSDWARK